MIHENTKIDKICVLMFGFLYPLISLKAVCEDVLSPLQVRFKRVLIALNHCFIIIIVGRLCGFGQAIIACSERGRWRDLYL